MNVDIQTIEEKIYRVHESGMHLQLEVSAATKGAQVQGGRQSS